MKAGEQQAGIDHTGGGGLDGHLGDEVQENDPVWPTLALAAADKLR